MTGEVEYRVLYNALSECVRDDDSCRAQTVLMVTNHAGLSELFHLE